MLTSSFGRQTLILSVFWGFFLEGGGVIVFFKLKNWQMNGFMTCIFIILLLFRKTPLKFFDKVI